MESPEAIYKTDDDLDGDFYEQTLRRLCGAVLLQALEDCRSDDPAKATAARAWLASLGLDLAEGLGWKRESVLAWLGSLPELRQMGFKFEGEK